MDLNTILTLTKTQLEQETNNNLIKYINFLADQFDNYKQEIIGLGLDIESEIVDENSVFADQKTQSFQHKAIYLVEKLDSIETKQLNIILILNSRFDAKNKDNNQANN